MTLREKVIVETYTGVCIVTGADREELYKYWAALMGRPLYTHELASKEIQEELKEKSKVAFSLVGTEGFEPPISCSQNTRLSQAGLRPVRNLCGASRSIEGSLGNLPRLQSVVSALPDYTYEAVFEHRQRQ